VKQAATQFFTGRSQTARGARLAVGASLMTVPAGAILSRPKRAYSAYKHSAAIVASVMQLVSVLPALGPNYKLGFRVGTMPEAKSMDQIAPMIAATQVGPDYLAYTPFPVPEFGMAAVPNDSQRFAYEMNKSSTKSRAREDTVRSSRVPGPVKTPKSMGGPSAQPRRKPSRKKVGISGARLRVRGGTRLRESPRYRSRDEEILDKYYTRRR
jgi:hypothetical protein